MFDAPAWGWRGPFGELENMRRQLERFSHEFGRGTSRSRSAGVFPLLNLTEDNDAYHIRTELPGLKAEDLDISVTGNNIAISGERKIPPEDKEARYHRREREAGRFNRMISLPGEVDSSGVEASLSNGILTMVVPKAEKAKPRQITVT
jgi:HSP20 family protein